MLNGSNRDVIKNSQIALPQHATVDHHTFDAIESIKSEVAEELKFFNVLIPVTIILTLLIVSITFLIVEMLPKVWATDFNHPYQFNNNSLKSPTRQSLHKSNTKIGLS